MTCLEDIWETPLNPEEQGIERSYIIDFDRDRLSAE